MGTPSRRRSRVPVARLTLALAAAGALGLWLTARVAGPSALPLWVPGVHAPLPLIGERRIATTIFYALALGPDGTHYAWGSGRHNGLRTFAPDPDTDGMLLTPVAIDPAARSWRYISGGEEAAYAITESGELLHRAYSWWDRRKQHFTSNERGEIVYIDGTPWVDRTPTTYTALHPDERWVKVREAYGRTIGLTETGRLFHWLELRLRECANGGTIGCTPEAIDTRSDWADFCVGREPGQNTYAGGYWAYALDRKGQLWHIADDIREPVMTPMPIGERAVRLFCTEGSGAVYFLDRSRRLWAFSSRPTADPAKVNLRMVSSRKWLMAVPGPGGLNAGVASDHTLWAWGPFYPKIDREAEAAAQEPYLVDDQHEWQEVDVGEVHLVARTVQGEIFTWGFNHCRLWPQCGVLGAGPLIVRKQPEPVRLPGA